MCSNGLVATPCQSSLSVWYRFLLQHFAIEWYLSGNSSNHWRKSGNGRCHVRALGEKASEHCAATANKARMCHFFNNSQYTHKRKEHSQCQDLETSHAVTTFTCTLPFLDRHTSHHQHTSLSRTTSHSNCDSLAITSLCFPWEISQLLFVLSLSTHANSTTFCEHIHHALWPSAASLQVLT